MPNPDFASAEVALGALLLEIKELRTVEQRRISKVLRALGWVLSEKRTSRGQPYLKPSVTQ